MTQSSGFSCSYRPVFEGEYRYSPFGNYRTPSGKLVLRSFLKCKPKERTKGVPNRHAMHTRMVTEGKSAFMVYLHPTKGWRRRFLAGF